MARYMPLKEGSDDDTVDQEVAWPIRRTTASLMRKNLVRVYLASVHLVILLLVIRLLYAHRERQDLQLHMLPSEFALAKEAVRYEEVTFDPSGFWGNDSIGTPYEGPPTPEIDEKWKHLVRVGMYSLTQDEYDHLDLETSVVPGQKDEYIITLEVFHQLHCLNYLRKRAYGFVPYEPTEHGKRAHLAHCVDYLRQILMCHGDLTPITLTYNKETDFVDPNFRIRHTCRNFDSIWEFAAKRNRSGISIEG